MFEKTGFGPIFAVVFVGAVLIVVTLCVMTSIVAKSNYEAGYVDACKDFYKGHVKYDLVENSDGTKEWKKINNEINQPVVFQHGNFKHGAQVK